MSLWEAKKKRSFHKEFLTRVLEFTHTGYVGTYQATHLVKITIFVFYWPLFLGNLILFFEGKKSEFLNLKKFKSFVDKQFAATQGTSIL